MTKKKTYYITTAIAYANGAPHIGHAYEFMIGDFLARANKMLNKDVFFLTGTDEHGQKIEKTAIEKQEDTKEFVNAIVLKFKKLCETFNIDYSRFIRTTDKDHLEVVKEFFNKVNDNGDIYKDSYEGYYCMYCETFYPKSHLLEGNLCPSPGCNRETKIIKEDAYFFKLSKYQERLINLLETDQYKILPVERKNEILSRLKNIELKDLCVTRLKSSVSWGIDFPLDDNMIIYVWFDALINYISGIKYGTDYFNHYWPCNAHIIGKDILWFHSVIWPAMLMSAKVQTPKALVVHGFINDKNGDKMSKSKGNVIEPFKLAQKYDDEVIRYYLLKTSPITKDIKFNENDLIEVYNSDLSNSLGNLISRAHTLIKKYQNSQVKITKDFDKIIDSEEIILKITNFIENFKVKKYIDYVQKEISKINKYINDKAPWKCEDDKRDIIIYSVVDSIRIINILIQPMLPKTHERIKNQLGLTSCKNIDDLKNGILSKGIISEKEILFPKLEISKRIFPLKLINGKILDVQDHPQADKLFILKVDVGQKQFKQLVAGLKGIFSKDELLDKKIIVVDNLKYAKIRGVVSEGMALAVEDNKGKVELLYSVDDSVGKLASVKDYQVEDKTIKFEEFMKLKLSVKDKKLYFNDVEILISNKNIETKSIENSTIVR